MLAALLSMCLVHLLPQDPAATLAVAVRGEAELTPAAALASARHKVDDHVRALWQERAQRAVGAARPFWVPEALSEQAVRRWLAALPVERLAVCVDREDKEREHEFGRSYQTTIWVAEDTRSAQRSEQGLRQELRQLERRTAVKYGGIAAGWIGLFVLLGWIDRLSRGYMTGRLRLVGLLGAAAVPAFAFLV
jgi:hypothetical protein